MNVEAATIYGPSTQLIVNPRLRSASPVLWGVEPAIIDLWRTLSVKTPTLKGILPLGCCPPAAVPAQPSASNILLFEDECHLIIGPPTSPPNLDAESLIVALVYSLVFRVPRFVGRILAAVALNKQEIIANL